MADPALIVPGQINAAGDRKALFLKVYAGEVLNAFEETNVFASLTQSRSISSGKSAQFPATWKVTAAYHTPGTELPGQATNQNERVITIDDRLVSDVVIDDLEDAMTHFDYRSEYTKQVGAALSRQYDITVAKVLANASRATATVTGGDDGGFVFDAAAKTDGTILFDLVTDANVQFDEKDIPEMDRFAAFKPAQYQLLAQEARIINSDFGGGGNVKSRNPLMIDNTNLVKSNNVPVTNVTGSFKAEYDGNFTTTAGVVFHRGAVGTVKLMDLQTEMWRENRRLADWIAAYYAIGHGILRPECATEILTAVRV